MDSLRAPSPQSLLESDRGSNDSLLAESLQLDFDELDDNEYSLPRVDNMPSLESVLSELDADSDIVSDGGDRFTPTLSIDERPKAGTMLRHIVLQGVSAQLASATNRVNSGLATSVAVSDMIAIGTSHGHILAFDILQTLRWCCQEHLQQGAVSSLAFNDASTRLLAGFARGQIVMIDTVSGDTIRKLVDVITPNSGVLNVKWTGRPALALCSDSGGSVWSLSFTRRLGKRGCDSKCLFSGARGEVCSIEPLIVEEDEHPLKAYCIVALATLSKFFIVMIRPRLKVIKFYALQGPADSLPLISWQMVLIQSADSTRIIDPVLAAARGNNIYFHQISIQSGKITSIFLRHIALSYNLLALHWMGPRTVATIDRSEILHLTDVRKNKELECIDVANAGLVFASANFKGFATGGNVSPALALAGTNACYNSIVCRGSQLYILGGRSLQSINVRSWSDRISHLVQNQRWCEACSLAIEGYHNAVNRPRRKQIARDRIIQLVEEYLVASERCPELCLGSIIACLIEIKEYEMLWQDLWDRLDKPDTYLLLMTEQIENGAISELSPIVAQSLCTYWLKHSTQRLEEIILKLDWKCLDLHQVLSASKVHKLYRAQIHLTTRALADYSLPLTELIPLIANETGRDLGNYLLVFISCCLCGRGYPTGDIDAENVQNVKHEVLRTLTSIHSSHASDNELSYPYLRALLVFDVRETLNVISLAFQEKEFSGELGLSHRQRIINILLSIMEPEHFQCADIGCLMNFIAHEISTQTLPDESVLLQKVFDYFRTDIANDSLRQHSERENAWLELLDAERINFIGQGEMLKIAENAKCYRVVLYILERQKSFDKILNCYLNDPRLHAELWSYIRTHAGNAERKIYAQCRESFERLLSIDADQMTDVIIDCFLNDVDQFIRLIEQDDRKYFRFVQSLLRHSITIDTNDSETFLNLMCQFEAENVIEFLKCHENYRLDHALEIVRKYELFDCMIYLYEKSGDFNAAFNLSLDLLKEAPESTAEMGALELSALCSRASRHLGDSEREQLWFSLIKTVLSRSDLAMVTRNILSAASGNVDLSQLVQLVLHSGTKSRNYGDIKHLIVGMLANSKYETLLLQTTARILGHDLHNKLAKERKASSHGLTVKSIKCITCRMRLYNQQEVIVFGLCGHAMHRNCIPKDIFSSEEAPLNECPRCGIILTEEQPAELAKPKNDFFEILSDATNEKLGKLQLEAPPRIIGGY